MGFASFFSDYVVVVAGEGQHEGDEENREDQVGDAGEALLPEMVGTFVGRAEPANVLQRCAHGHGITSRSS